MSDFEIAVERLTAWLRDYGCGKSQAFQGDLSIVLLAAQDSVRKQAEIERLTWERDNVAMMLRRVLRATESPLHAAANDLLRRLELQGSPLRDEAESGGR